MGMSRLLWGTGRPNPVQLDVLLERARNQSVTYAHVGSTLASGDRLVRRRQRHLGHGRETLSAARASLRGWVAHRGIGAVVHPGDVPLETGQTVLVVLSVGPLWVIAPNRIVSVVDEDDRFGFAYGSLPGHPQRGEESFAVESDDDGDVRAVVAVDARPGTLPTCVAAPLVLAVQRWAVDRYLSALATACEGQQALATNPREPRHQRLAGTHHQPPTSPRGVGEKPGRR
jgi:uncharacterized protein (UPF0548 family)